MRICSFAHLGAVCEELAAEEQVSEEQHAHHYHQIEELTEEVAVRPHPVSVHRAGHVPGQSLEPWDTQKRVLMSRCHLIPVLRWITMH